MIIKGKYHFTNEEEESKRLRVAPDLNPGLLSAKGFSLSKSFLSR